jgi:hypothetical protein
MASSRIAVVALALLLPITPAWGVEPVPSELPPTHQEAPAWAVTLALPSPLRAGVAATATFQLIARAGHHVNLEYPTAFKPDARSNVTVAGPRVALATVGTRPCPGRPGETCELTLALPFTPGAAQRRLSGTVLFSVCTAERCLIERIALGAEASP